MAELTLSKDQAQAVEWLCEKFYKNEMRSTLINLSRIKVKLHECKDYNNLKLNREEVDCIVECIQRVISKEAVREKYPEKTEALKTVIDL